MADAVIVQEPQDGDGVCTASKCAGRSSLVLIVLWTRVVRTAHGSGVVGVFSDLM